MTSMTFAGAATRAPELLGRTANGAATNITTHSACVDFFGQAPAMRGKEAQALILFQRAYAENPDIALRTLLWLRDARGGAGERGTFRYILSWLSQTDSTTAARIVMRTPELGRWDDLFAVGGPAREFALTFYDHALLSQNDRLAAKWAPREGSARDADAKALAAHMGLTPAQYRKVIAGLSDTVEQKMCARKWDDINFSHVPSVAAKRYQKAFGKRAADAYNAYKAALQRNDGSAKVNASAIFPHDVITGLRRGDAVVAEAQWKALPDYLGGDGGMLPLIDTSGSMGCPLGGDSKGSVTCLDVSVALGIYIAERQTGPFHNLVMEFSSDASVVQLADTMSLEAKIRAVRNKGYMGSTNIEAAFRKILQIAVQNNVAPADMPKRLLILSDMEFNQAVDTGTRTFAWADRRAQAEKTALDMVTQEYAKAGYTRPQIIFWNLNARLGNNPVTIRDDGTAMVGGYSPALLKSLLAAETYTPESAMLSVVMADRYKLD